MISTQFEWNFAGRIQPNKQDQQSGEQNKYIRAILLPWHFFPLPILHLHQTINFPSSIHVPIVQLELKCDVMRTCIWAPNYRDWDLCYVSGVWRSVSMNGTSLNKMIIYAAVCNVMTSSWLRCILYMCILNHCSGGYCAALVRVNHFWFELYSPLTNGFTFSSACNVRARFEPSTQKSVRDRQPNTY